MFWNYKVKANILLGIMLVVSFTFVAPTNNNNNNNNIFNQGAESAKTLFQEAQTLISKKRYKNAAKLLEKVIQIDKAFFEAYLKLSIAEKALEHFDKAEAILDKAQPYLPIAQQPKLQYKLSKLYYALGAYKKAQIINLSIATNKVSSKSLLKKIASLRSNIDFALSQLQHPIAIHPQKLPTPLNQFPSQYFPILTVDQKTILFTALVGKQDAYKEAIYISHLDEDGNWTVPVSISQEINDPNSNQGTCSISADKKTLVFAACGKEGNYGICDLYISYKKQNVWTKPENLGPQINSDGWQSQPSLTADGKTLYFVSERAGNLGKHDIWKSTLQPDGTWAQAMNLGPIINTKGKEVAPFIHPNKQTLFFASDRTPSMGGFDIYYSNFVDGEWTQPVNLGYPINNHKDQASIFITADGKKAYYADGKREGFFKNSYLYTFDIPNKLINMPASAAIQLSITDHASGNPIEATVEVYEVNSAHVLQSLLTDPFDGEVTIMLNQGKEYLVCISKDGYIYESQYINYKHGSIPHVNWKINHKIKLQPIALGETKILNNVYFAHDSYVLDKNSEAELHYLIKFLQLNPHIKIILEGHTDNTGSTQYNQDLSVKRAQSIFQYLVEAGIDDQRLSYIGYGKSRPLAKNSSRANRQLNRRVAFKIVAID